MSACLACGKPERQSADVIVLVVWLDTATEPYPLVPEEGYSVCLHPGCRAMRAFVERATDAHPVTRAWRTWSRAHFVFSDGSYSDLHHGPQAAVGIA